MDKKYVLEIYEPGSDSEVQQVLRSDTPFLAIHWGDFVNPSAWTLNAQPMAKLLQVVKVEHILSEDSSGKDVKHNICVYTRIDDSDDNESSAHRSEN